MATLPFTSTVPGLFALRPNWTMSFSDFSMFPNGSLWLLHFQAVNYKSRSPCSFAYSYQVPYNQFNPSLLHTCRHQLLPITFCLCHTNSPLSSALPEWDVIKAFKVFLPTSCFRGGEGSTNAPLFFFQGKIFTMKCTQCIQSSPSRLEYYQGLNQANSVKLKFLYLMIAERTQRILGNEFPPKQQMCSFHLGN